MDAFATDKAAIEVPAATKRGGHFLKPKLVAEITYGALTTDGILRHASFIGLRKDKSCSGGVLIAKGWPTAYSASGPKSCVAAEFHETIILSALAQIKAVAEFASICP